MLEAGMQRVGQRVLPAAALLVVTSLLVACAQAGASGQSKPGTRAGAATSGAAAANTVACAPIDDEVTRVEASVVRIETLPDAKGEISAGTGFVIGSDVVLTNQHVVAGVDRVFTTFKGGRRVMGQVMVTNEAQDLALIQTDTGQVPPITWGDDRALSRGTHITAIGYAQDKPGLPTVSTGTYLQTYVDPPTGQAYLLSDLSLDHGDSGGPLLNNCGEVVGVNTAKIRSEERAGLSIPEFLAQRWASEQIQQQR